MKQTFKAMLRKLRTAGSSGVDPMPMPRSEIEKIAGEAVAARKKILSDTFKKLLRRLKTEAVKALDEDHRRMLVISGGSPEKQGVLAGASVENYVKARLRRGKENTKLLYMYHDEFDSSRVRKEAFRLYVKQYASHKELGVERTIDVYEKTDRYLGTTFDILVLDLNDDLKPNDIGRLVEVVRGGGIIILLIPSWDSWDTKMTIFKQKLLVPGYDEPRHVFIKWFKNKLLEADGVFIYDVEKDEVIKKPRRKKGKKKKASEEEALALIEERELFPRKLYELALTRDQAEAVRLMEKLVPKPRRGKKTVIVITADRGRGKSCAMGIGLVGIAESLRPYKNRVRILLTAPSPNNVQSLFMLAVKAAETLGHNVKVIEKEGNIIEIKGPFYSIEYWEPIVIPKLRGDVVAVDEASGIHVPQLLRIYNAHDRLIFSATIHGYEGAGRGFSIRFLGTIKEDKRSDLHTLELKTPIRYGSDDPIEKWLYRTLLLDAEPAELDERDLEEIKRGELEYHELKPEELFTSENEEKLRQLFGIYVLAHYRNQPDDLGLLADAPHHIIRAVTTKTSGKIVASLQIAVEGGLDNDMIELLLRGNKIPGNIIPDRLLKHLRIREAGSMRGYRIVRIATHPDVQDKGIGSFALERLFREAVEKGLDWVGSGFGVNYKLLNFWVKNDFIPVHMSPDRNPVSGEYTIIVIKPISEEAVKLVEIARRVFREKILKSLRDTYRDLETDVALLILRSLGGEEERGPPVEDPINIDRLWIYAYGPMTYEALSDVMYDVALHYWMHRGKSKLTLTKDEEWVLIARVLQGRDWEEVATELGGRDKYVMLTLKDVAKKVLSEYYGRNLESSVGYTLSEVEGD